MYFINVFIIGEFMYKQQWSEFEVQSLAFSILRKHLYPQFLIRGEYKFDGCRVDIAIFKAHKDKEPELKLVLEVKKSQQGTTIAQGTRYEEILGVPCIYVRGASDAYNVLSLVQEYLYK